MSRSFRYLLSLLLFLFSSFSTAANIGDIVSNRASATYSISGVDHNISSNEVNQTIVGTDATIQFMTVLPTGSESHLLGNSSYYGSDNLWHLMPPPTLPGGGTLSTTTPEAMSDALAYREDDLALIKVTDLDQNRDSTLREIIDVNVTSPSGDLEQIRLIETGPDTGIFTGYVFLVSAPSTSLDGNLHVEPGDTISVSYDNQGMSIKTDSAIVLVQKRNLKVWIEKKVNKEVSSIGEVLQYTITLKSNEESDLHYWEIDDYLPSGLKYLKGSAKIDGVAVVDRMSSDGKHLFFNVNLLPAKGSVKITFLGLIGAGVVHNELINRVIAKYGRKNSTTKVLQKKGNSGNAKKIGFSFEEKGFDFVTNVAIARTVLEEELIRSKGVIIGQVYECRHKENRKGYGIPEVRLYMENGTYVVTDQNGKYHIEGVDAGTHVIQVDTALLPEGYVLGKHVENTRFAGSKFSQFVNTGKGSLKRVDFCLDRIQKVKSDNNASRSQSKVVDINDYQISTTTPVAPKYNRLHLKSIEKRATILWPPEKFVPSIPSTRIAVAHQKNLKAEVWLNDQKVSMLNYDGRISDHNSTMVIDTYKGVDLLDQTNTITVKMIDRQGKIVETLKRTLHVSNKPVKIEYVEKNSLAVADGKHSPVIAVRFIDADGYPLRAGITGTFTIEPPYRSQVALDQLQENPLGGASVSQNRYTIDSDGIAYIKLQPTTQSGTASLHFKIQDRDEVIRAWLKPQLREWIMVGFAEGTVGYKTLKGHQENLKAIGAEDKVVKEGRVSFFAKGRIKGEWLLTMAYDSGKDTKNSKFFDEIDPNTYYTLYNDGSIQNYEAASRKKLFVKIEKERFSALYGDYSTDMTVTELAQYSRRLTGLKSEYHGEYFEGTAFVAQTDQLFMKDEIRGDGTSGYYYLTHKPVIWNSETVRIEVRDRYHPERIVEKRVLQRFRDYEIDYDRGTLYFKEPVYSTDGSFNPRYIVVDYEIRGEGGKHYTFGGRGAFKTLKGAVEIGSSFISEDNVKQKTQLIGVDTKIKLGTATTMKAEYAKTKTTQEGNTTYGDAKYAEIEHVANGLYVRAYYREQEDSFGLGQLSSSLGATRLLGIDATKTFENRLRLRSSAYRNSDLLNHTDQDVFETRIEMDQTLWSAYMGYRYAHNTDTAAVHQMLFGASYAFFDQRLKLSVTHDQSFGKDEDRLFPTRTTVGMDYALNAKVNLFASYEWQNGSNADSELGRIGMRYRPWAGMTLENTTVSEFTNDVSRIYNTMGALQNYQFDKHWSFSVGYEHGELLDGNATAQKVNFDAYHLGVNYRTGEWTATLAGEYRDAANEKKYNITAGIYTQATEDLAFALSAGYNQFEKTLERTEDANVRFSVAYRPEQTDVIVLDKLDLVHQKRNALEDEMYTQKVINNLVVNYTPNERTEISLQHGIKYVRDTVNSYEFKGVTQLFGVDVRYDITGKWMVGAQGSLLYAHSADNLDYGAGAYTGYNIFTSMLLIGGYNWEGFEDRDFSLQNYRVEGPYIQFKMKFDQKNLKALVKWMSW